ncbi:DUF309 domain-containing protein [Salipaludibacillus daqingensis]|uniref:DUF309 domain-containing protein n=1 Tax=Salipaludibacillus daqingensis TaxID=3041001 RepID=UPI002473A485|nr:DUF309 domain-containing protein [Salipaludibacillus daqingensis]
MKNYPEPYLDYLIHFHASRDYFECHEIMEEYWLENNRQKKWLALIQLAVAVYHERQKNYSGSLRLYRKVLSHLRTNKSMLDDLSIHQADLEQLVKSRIKNILNDGDYQPMNIPIFDEDLIHQCVQLAEEKGWKWLSSEEKEQELIFRHKLRDRSDVILARQHSLIKKKKEREEQ